MVILRNIIFLNQLNNIQQKIMGKSLHLCKNRLIIYVPFYLIILFMIIFSIANFTFDITMYEYHNFPILNNTKNLSVEEIQNMSNLGKWLIHSGSNIQPEILYKKHPFLILIWKYGPLLEYRHLKYFTNKTHSPWEYCTVKNCVLSYDDNDLLHADAVVFHLHRIRNATQLPKRSISNQIWIFSTDESPINTFLYKNQNLSSYDGIFNWSMTYRMDSDIPVPYGRTIFTSTKNQIFDFKKFIKNTKQLKTKLVAIMGSNCKTANDRWNYVKQLKILLGNQLDILGHCLNGNTTICPGHFKEDCPALNVYKFYLAFENSNCREYMTEKVFYHGYEKLAVPIIMGSKQKYCKQLLPPYSFLHIEDFVGPKALVDYINYLDKNDDQYFEYHYWRLSYKVVNEHGYFGTISKHYCRICEALHYNNHKFKLYQNFQLFWDKNKDCYI